MASEPRAAKARYNERFIALRWIVGSLADLIGFTFGLLGWPFLELADRILPTARRPR